MWIGMFRCLRSPARISRLNELAYDLWWSRSAPGREVFRDLDYALYADPPVLRRSRRRARPA